MAIHWKLRKNLNPSNPNRLFVQYSSALKQISLFVQFMNNKNAYTYIQFH